MCDAGVEHRQRQHATMTVVVTEEDAFQPTVVPAFWKPELDRTDPIVCAEADHRPVARVEPREADSPK